MSTTILMDASGRLVLPKAIRERLNLASGASMRAEVVAGRIETLFRDENYQVIQDWNF